MKRIHEPLDLRVYGTRRMSAANSLHAVRDVADSNWRADPKKMAGFDKDTVYQGYVELYENVLSTLGKGGVMTT